MNYLLGKNLTTEDPYVFKLTNGEQSFTLVGTLHILPISILSPVLYDMLLNNNKLLIVELYHKFDEIMKEWTKVDNDEVELEKTNEFLKNNFHNEDFGIAPWFDSLPSKYQNWVVDICGLIPSSSETIHNTLANIHSFHVQAIHGMDLSIIDYFNKKKSQIIGLENFNEQHNENLASSEKELIEELVNTIEMSNEFGGILAAPALISNIQHYLCGDYYNSVWEEDKFLEERNKLWINRLLKILNHYKTDVLCTVGIDHIMGKTGLISLLNAQQWDVAQIQCDGEIKPFDLNSITCKQLCEDSSLYMA